MKPFDLSEALEGKPVVTRDGRKVTYITHLSPRLIGGILENTEKISTWNSSGYFLNDSSTHSCDLFMYIEKKSVWVNVYEDEKGDLFLMEHSSKDEAHKSIISGTYIKTIEITNESDI